MYEIPGDYYLYGEGLITKLSSKIEQRNEHIVFHVRESQTSADVENGLHDLLGWSISSKLSENGEASGREKRKEPSCVRLIHNNHSRWGTLKSLRFLKCATHMQKMYWSGLPNHLMFDIINTHTSLCPHMKHVFEDDLVVGSLSLRMMVISMPMKNLLCSKHLCTLIFFSVKWCSLILFL